MFLEATVMVSVIARFPLHKLWGFPHSANIPSFRYLCAIDRNFSTHCLGRHYWQRYRLFTSSSRWLLWNRMQSGIRLWWAMRTFFHRLMVNSKLCIDLVGDDYSSSNTTVVPDDDPLDDCSPDSHGILCFFMNMSPLKKLYSNVTTSRRHEGCWSYCCERHRN